MLYCISGCWTLGIVCYLKLQLLSLPIFGMKRIRPNYALYLFFHDQGEPGMKGMKGSKVSIVKYWTVFKGNSSSKSVNLYKMAQFEGILGSHFQPPNVRSKLFWYFNLRIFSLLWGKNWKICWTNKQLNDGCFVVEGRSIKFVWADLIYMIFLLKIEKNNWANTLGDWQSRPMMALISAFLCYTFWLW